MVSVKIDRSAQPLGKSIALFFIAILAVFSLSQTHAENKQPSKIEPCIPFNDFVLGGVTLRDSYESIHKKLGKPKSIDVYRGEDDGGEYTGESLNFNDVTVYYEKNRGIEMLSTASRNIPLMLGINIGMSATEVSNKLHINVLSDPELIEIRPCGEDFIDTQYVHFYFIKPQDNSSQRILNKVDIFHYGP